MPDCRSSPRDADCKGSARPCGAASGLARIAAGCALALAGAAGAGPSAPRALPHVAPHVALDAAPDLAARLASPVASPAVSSRASGRGAAARAARGPLHVPSPDWRDQVIYFVMTDRFADGDPSNNDQGAGEYGP